MQFKKLKDYSLMRSGKAPELGQLPSPRGNSAGACGRLIVVGSWLAQIYHQSKALNLSSP